MENNASGRWKIHVNATNMSLRFERFGKYFVQFRDENNGEISDDITFWDVVASFSLQHRWKALSSGVEIPVSIYQVSKHFRGEENHKEKGNNSHWFSYKLGETIFPECVSKPAAERVEERGEIYLFILYA